MAEGSTCMTFGKIRTVLGALGTDPYRAVAKSGICMTFLLCVDFITFLTTAHVPELNCSWRHVRKLMVFYYYSHFWDTTVHPSIDCLVKISITF